MVNVAPRQMGTSYIVLDQRFIERRTSLRRKDVDADSAEETWWKQNRLHSLPLIFVWSKFPLMGAAVFYRSPERTNLCCNATAGLWWLCDFIKNESFLIVLHLCTLCVHLCVGGVWLQVSVFHCLVNMHEGRFLSSWLVVTSTHMF